MVGHAPWRGGDGAHFLQFLSLLQGDLLLGALVDREVRRLDLSGAKVPATVVAEESLFEQLAARIRDVRVGPGGALYVLTPDRVVRVTPGQGG